MNEDFLFDVDIEKRELCPAYWLGPVYDVRRGTWFYTDGIPCDENLATQLEEGYLKTRPWRFARQEPRAPSKPRSRPASMTLKGGEPTRRLRGHSKSNPLTPRASAEDLKDHAVADRAGDASPKLPPEEPTNAYRLFGAHMNSVVTYQDELTAWLLTDDFLSRMSSTLYQRFAGGGHFAGVKLIRGFVDLSKKRSEKDADRPDAPAPASSREGGADRRADSDKEDATSDDDSSGTQSPSRARIKTFERHMSSLVGSGPEDLEKREEEIRKRDEKEMREDYKDTADEQGREIEHLIFVTHGIGQRLGMRMESVNFIHDVNTLRKSLKSVYAKSADLQALNCEVETMPKNCRVQVLPICWRHLLDFPKQSLKHNRREHDLGDVNFEDHEYPNLDDITVEGVPAVRNLLTDLALDILLYQSPAYKGHISRVVFQECNRIYRLFRERNPSFNGKVSLIGHSLGSAIMFDLLCQQRASTTQASKRRATADRVQLDFEVEDFYALGSPIGLFQMLKGRMITARPPSDFASLRSSSDSTDGSLSQAGTGGSAARELEITTSSPKCKQMFNIFHPTDPISYRLEPLISPAMSSLKPQPLPYTKKGIFGAPVGQGLTGIGARVGQGVSGFWSSLSSGIASGILNRSLGITGTDAAKHSSDLSLPQKSSRPLSVGAVPAAGGEPGMAFYNEERKRRLAEEPIAPGDVGEHPPTLLDAEIETLFAGFQKQTKGQQTKGQQASTNRAADEDLQWQELEDRSRKLRREEAKVRALNANGRVDYSIQEGVRRCLPSVPLADGL